jgi:hypothetical protein
MKWLKKFHQIHLPSNSRKCLPFTYCPTLLISTVIVLAVFSGGCDTTIDNQRNAKNCNDRRDIKVKFNLKLEHQAAFLKRQACNGWTFDPNYGGVRHYPCKTGQNKTRGFIGWFNLNVIGCNQSSNNYPEKIPWCNKNAVNFPSQTVKFKSSDDFESMITADFWSSCDMCNPPLNASFKAEAETMLLPHEKKANLTLKVKKKKNGMFKPFTVKCN